MVTSPSDLITLMSPTSSNDTITWQCRSDKGVRYRRSSGLAEASRIIGSNNLNGLAKVNGLKWIDWIDGIEWIDGTDWRSVTVRANLK